jgi:LMBR1 domain-containing protein 1
LATITTILALGLVFSCLALLPVDIFLVSSTVDPLTGLKKAWATPDTIENMQFVIQLVYYGKIKKNSKATKKTLTYVYIFRLLWDDWAVLLLLDPVCLLLL